MPVVAIIYPCKKCGTEIRSDWHFCPNCGDKIICNNRHKELIEEYDRKRKEGKA